MVDPSAAVAERTGDVFRFYLMKEARLGGDAGADSPAAAVVC